MKLLTIKIRLLDDSDGALSSAVYRARRALAQGECAAWQIVHAKTGEIVLDSKHEK